MCRMSKNGLSLLVGKITRCGEAQMGRSDRSSGPGLGNHVAVHALLALVL
jgi:hypothetical protein